MLMNILFLFFVFIFGLFYTFFSFFPRKKILAWFHSISVNTTSAHITTTDTRSINGVDKRVELRRVFATFDKNNDGYITKQELRESLTNMGIFVSFDDVADMVAKVDCNGDGLIDFDEFHELYGSMMMRKESGRNDDEDEDKEGDLEEAFQVFDGDGDGLITVEELGLVLSSLGFKEGKTLESCKEMIKKVDIDGDGMVNFDEFKKMMKDGKNLISMS